MALTLRQVMEAVPAIGSHKNSKWCLHLANYVWRICGDDYEIRVFAFDTKDDASTLSFEEWALKGNLLDQPLAEYDTIPLVSQLWAFSVNTAETYVNLALRKITD